MEWEFQRTAAHNTVANLFGVTGISNNITISPTVKPVDIKKKIVAAIERNALLDSENIYVESTGSKVTLTGTVRSWTEKGHAEKTACAAPGVLFVDCQLEVVPGPFPG